MFGAFFFLFQQKENDHFQKRFRKPGERAKGRIYREFFIELDS